jgi:hypothetical protein
LLAVAPKLPSGTIGFVMKSCPSPIDASRSSAEIYNAIRLSAL